MDFEIVRVFSATKAREREALGERVTEWVQEFKGEVVSYEVRQSSDSGFHCLTVILFAKAEASGRSGAKRRRDPEA